MQVRRRVRLDTIRREQRERRSVKGVLKRGERARRDARVAALLRQQQQQGIPASPLVQSWVASHLGRPYNRASRQQLEELAGRF